MDPLSQGLWGASFAQVAHRKAHRNRKKSIVSLTLIGALAGMAADLDVLLYSSTDPLFSLIYHRHFTHSLFFVPLGALLVAVVLFKFFKALSFKEVYFYSFMGYLSHGILDSCTSYGTLWLWPLSYERISWNVIPIIDPLFTLPLLACVVLAVKKKKLNFGKIGFLLSVTVLLLGFFQNQRAQKAIRQEAYKRGHNPESIYVRPAFFSLLSWRGLYEHNHQFFVQRVLLGVFNPNFLYPVNSIEKLNLQKHLGFLSPSSRQYKDVKTFLWFTQNFVGFDPRDKHFLGDLRYSLEPSGLTSLWGILLTPQNSQEPVQFIHRRRGKH